MSPRPGVAEMARRLAARETSAADLAEAALAAIAARDGAIRAFVALDAEGARRAARESDARRAQGAARGPLDGIPVAVKDNLDVAGLPTAAGTRRFAGRIAAADAAAVARLRAAGAVILGKLNMHEGALGATTDNPFWGRCDNPARPGHTPGGSSGGSAAAVAAGFAPLTLGTDTMGSVRIPAAYCGLWGLKPTPGAVPAEGLVPLSPTLDTIGPIAADADGLAAAFAALSGQAAAAGPPPLAGLRLGLPEEAGAVALEPAVRAAFDAFAARLAARGVALRSVPVAGWDPGRLRRAGLLLAEAEAAEALGPALAEDAAAGGGGFSPGFRAALAYGRDAPRERLAAARARVAASGPAVTAALAEVAALLMPTAPQRPFPHGAPVPDNQADLTALANCARVPAVAFPIPAADGGFPASAQVLGPPGSEVRLIALAAALAAA